MNSRVASLVRFGSGLSLGIAAIAAPASAQSFFGVSNVVSVRGDHATTGTTNVNEHTLLADDWGPELFRGTDGAAYAVTSSSNIHANPNLYHVDEFTGEFTWLRTLGVNLSTNKEVEGVAVHPATGDHYLLLRVDYTLMVLCRFDFTTGVVTGPTLLSSSHLMGLAFDSNNDLYSLDFDTIPGWLRRIDAQNPQNSTLIGTGLGTGLLETNITFDPSTGKLIGMLTHLVGGPSTVFEIDRTTGKAIQTKSLGFDGGTFFASSILATNCAGLGSFGVGCPGTGALTPKLSLEGCPFVGNAIELTASGTLGSSTAIFLFGGGAGAQPMGGGCSLLLQPLWPLAISTPTLGVGPGAGTTALSGILPLSLYGATIATQVFVVDPGNPIGASATNGVLFEVD